MKHEPKRWFNEWREKLVGFLSGSPTRRDADQ